MSIQIKSRKRVKELAEILTAKREVESITDLIKDLSEKIDSRFLEPSGWIQVMRLLQERHDLICENEG